MKIEYFNLAVKNLRKRKLRSWLTVLGIFISIAAIFTLVSLSLGLQVAVKKQFELLGSDKFFVMSKTSMLGTFEGGSNSLTDNDVNAIKNVRGIKDYTYITVGNIKMKYDNQIKYFMAAGLPLDHIKLYTESSSISIAQGKMIEAGDQKKIALGSLFYDGNIFNKPVEAGSKVEINGESYKVSGILKSIGNPSDDSNVYFPIEELRKLINVSNRVDQIVIQVSQGENVTDVAKRTEERLRKFRGQTEKTQDFVISTPEDLLASFQIILQIITAFLAGIAAISLLVGAIGIANTMYTSVIERTKEIGVMKAIGAKNSDITWIFLIESGLLGFIGGVVGVLLGYLMSKTVEFIAVNQLNTNLLAASSPWWLIVGCLLFGFLVGAVSGTLPAIQASKTNVVDALRYE